MLLAVVGRSASDGVEIRYVLPVSSTTSRLLKTGQARAVKVERLHDDSSWGSSRPAAEKIVWARFTKYLAIILRLPEVVHGSILCDPILLIGFRYLSDQP